MDISKLNLQDALDFAVLIEKEAEERYLWFAEMLGETSAASFFAMMAKNEQLHAVELAERRHSLFGDAPARITAEMIVEDIEAPDSGRPRPNMSARHAMEVAMESEIKAYEFYDKALPSIEDSSVRKLFVELRDEEVEHQNLLKKQIAKSSDTLAPEVDPDDVDTPAL